MKNLLEIKEITKVFGEGTVNEKVALNSVSLTLKEGDFVTIIGNNGAGKSTLLNCIAGVYAIDKGSIVLDEKDITKLPEHKRARWMGRVFQDPLKGTAFDMTIEENLAIAYYKNKSRGLGPGITSKDRELFREKLSMLEMGLEDKMTQKVKLLSGGQRQALTLLMATMATPKILLLDEHTAALDPGTAEKVLKLTKDIVEKDQITCMMITHNMHQALELGNRTFLMADGNIVLDVKGEERAHLTVDDLLAKFKEGTGKDLDNDRILLSN